MKSTLKWNELTEKGFTKKRTCNMVPTHHYEVTKPANLEWPEDSELISWCDGGPGMNFGGRTDLGKNLGVVSVYVD